MRFWARARARMIVRMQATLEKAPRGAFLAAIYFLKRPVFFPATESYGVVLDEAPVQIHQAKQACERS